MTVYGCCSDENIAQGAADFAVETARPVHGRHERRSIWTSSKLNGPPELPRRRTSLRRAARNP